MRKAKYFLCFMLILCGLVFGGEIYQDYLTNDWLLGSYEFSVKNPQGVSESQRNQTVKELAYKNNCDVFSYTVSFLDGKLAKKLIIYCDENGNSEIKKKLAIEGGNFNSLFSGSTHIIFKDFFEEDNNNGILRYYFLGDFEGVDSIRSSLVDDGYTCSSISLISDEIHNDQRKICILIWVALGVILLAFTWIDNQFKKKERLVLLSLGKPIYKMILESACVDTAVLIVIYSVLYLTLYKLTYLKYLKSITLPIFLVSIFANVILTVLIMSNMDIKKALSSFKSSSLALANAYLIKTVGVIVTIIILTINIVQIQNNTHILMNNNKIANLEGYSILSLVKSKEDINTNYDFDTYDQIEISVENTLVDKIYSDIFCDKYMKNEVTFAFKYAYMMSHEFLAYEKNSLYLLNSIKEIESIDFSKDIYLLIPGDIQESEYADILDSALSLNFEFSDETQINYEFITYKGDHNAFYYENVTSYDSKYFGSAKNPIITIYNFTNKTNNLHIKEGPPVFYKITEEDIEYYTELFSLENQEYNLVASNAEHVYQYGMNYYESLMTLNLVLSIFMILFEFIMIITIIKVEYMSNSIEMSLKKVYGYSLIKRNRSIFFLYTFGVFIGVFATALAAWLMQLKVLNIIFAVSGAILITEYLVMTYYIVKLEKVGVAKILKGGCL